MTNNAKTPTVKQAPARTKRPQTTYPYPLALVSIMAFSDNLIQYILKQDSDYQPCLFRPVKPQANSRNVIAKLEIKIKINTKINAYGVFCMVFLFSLCMFVSDQDFQPIWGKVKT